MLLLLLLLLLLWILPGLAAFVLLSHGMRVLGLAQERREEVGAFVAQQQRH